MTTRLRKFSVAFFIAALSGCYSVTFERPVVALDPAYRPEHFFLFGLIGTSTVDLAHECPRGYARFGDYFAPSDLLASILTLGIYTPRTAVIQCAA